MASGRYLGFTDTHDLAHFEAGRPPLWVPQILAHLIPEILSHPGIVISGGTSLYASRRSADPMPPAGPRTAGGEGEEGDVEHVKAS